MTVIKPISRDRNASSNNVRSASTAVHPHTESAISDHRPSRRKLSSSFSPACILVSGNTSAADMNRVSERAKRIIKSNKVHFCTNVGSSIIAHRYWICQMNMHAAHTSGIQLICTLWRERNNVMASEQSRVIPMPRMIDGATQMARKALIDDSVSKRRS